MGRLFLNIYIPTVGIKIKEKLMKQTKLWQQNFTLVVIGQIISLFGNGILRFALPLYLLNITGSSALFGIVTAVSFLPLVLLMPIGGIIADRTNKRNIMVMLDFLTGILMLFFYITIDVISLIPLLIATLMILYSIAGLYQPTVQASVPALLNENILVKGNGIVSSIGALANLGSPIIGGILLGNFGIAPIILVSIICFFASAVLELFIKMPNKKENISSSMITIIKSDMKLCVNFIINEKPTLKKLMFVTCLLNAFLSALIIISLPVLITERLSLSDELYGYASGVLAFGGLLGGLLAGVLGQKLSINNLSKYIFGAALALVPMAVAMFYSYIPIVAYALILVSAFLVMCLASLASIIIITYIQSSTPENMVGKIMAFVMTVSMFASPIGQAVYGIAFEYLIGYESSVTIVAMIISVLISFYSSKIKFY